MSGLGNLADTRFRADRRTDTSKDTQVISIDSLLIRLLPRRKKLFFSVLSSYRREAKQENFGFL